MYQIFFQKLLLNGMFNSKHREQAKIQWSSCSAIVNVQVIQYICAKRVFSLSVQSKLQHLIPYVKDLSVKVSHIMTIKSHGMNHNFLIWSTLGIHVHQFYAIIQADSSAECPGSISTTPSVTLDKQQKLHAFGKLKGSMLMTKNELVNNLVNKWETIQYIKIFI